MTRKDYELIARTLKAYGNGGESVEDIAKLLAHNLSLENPRFDRERFLEACGV